MWFIPGVGYINGQFVHDGIQYPKNWLAKADQAELDRLGAIRRPTYDAASQVCEKDEMVGWVVRAKTAEELASDEMARSQGIAQRLTDAEWRIWEESWKWGEKKFAEVDRTTVCFWLAAGVLDATGSTMCRAVIGWHDLIFSTYYAAAKDIIITAGDWVEPDWASWPACPHTFSEFFAHRLPV